MKLNTIPNEGQWSGISDRINENFSKVNTAFESVDKSTRKNCGLFPDVDALKYAHPNPIVGMWAGVGHTTPAVLYRCKENGMWTTDNEFWYENGQPGPRGPIGPQGPQGNSGYQGAAGELEVVNDLQQGGATAALSAEMGKDLTRYVDYGRIVGKGATIVGQRHYGFIGGHKYRINVKTPNWDVTSFGVTGDYAKFDVKYKLFGDDALTTIFWVAAEEQKNASDIVEPSYIFTAKENVEYIIIRARNTEDALVEYTIEDITQSNTMGYYFEGNANIYSSRLLFLRKDRRYKLSFPVTNWGLENKISSTEGLNLLEVGYQTETGSKSIISAKTFESIKSEYYFTAAADALHYIGGRANAGEKVYFDIIDVTDDWTKIILQGKGTTFVYMPIPNVVAGRNYRLTVLSDEWEVGDMEETLATSYQLELYYYTKEGEQVTPVKRSFGSSTTIKKYYDFAINEEVDVNRVYLGGRAVAGTDVAFRLELMPDAAGGGGDSTDKNSAILVGDNNNGVTTNFYLQKGVTYKVYLPDEKWDLSNITINYGYYYFLMDYFPAGATARTKIMSFNTDGHTPYRSSFEFTAPETTNYRVYIRANQGVEIPVFILPATDKSELSVFEEQMYKAGNLGFKRLPTTAIEGYIPTLSFMHISDTHCTNDNFLKPFERTVEIFNALAKNDVNEGQNVKFLLHTGDVRDHAYNSGYDFFAKVTSSLKRNIYVAAGNHDVGHKLDAAKAGTDEQLYEQMFAPMLEAWALKSDGGGTPHPDGKNYYFNDFTDEKVRMIVLYEWETDFELNPSDTSQLMYDRSSRAFRQAQVDWFINSLQTVPAGYGVIVVKHQPESIKGVFDNPFFSNVAVLDKKEMSTYCGTELIAQIVQAFIDRQSINVSVEQTGGVVTTLTAHANFSDVAEGAEFICYCSGHTHQDIVNFLRDYPKQLELTIGCNNVHYTSGTDMLQVDSDKSKNLINVYNIDRNRGYVYIVRIGADFSNTAQNRSFTAIKYRKNE